MVDVITRIVNVVNKRERKSNVVAKFGLTWDPLVFEWPARWFRCEEEDLGIR